MKNKTGLLKKLYKSNNLPSPIVHIITGILLTCIFVLDINIPLGVAGGVPYIIVILIAKWHIDNRYVIQIAVICTLLTLSGFYFSPSGGELWMVIFNRFLAIFAIWLTAILVLIWKTQEKELTTTLENEANANREKSSFLSSISHELRTPLTAIVGFSWLMIKKDALTPAQEKHIQVIHKAAFHLSELIDDILDLAKIESGKLMFSLEPVEAKVICNEALSMVMEQSEKRNISLDTQGLDDTSICADHVRFKQVLINLLSNAIKYNHTGGKVTLALEHKGDYVRFNVIDNGYGIEKDKLPELFEAFNRLGRESGKIKGSGIGLTLSKSLVELMGGRIGVESTPGEGSCFWIEFSKSTKHNTVEQAEIKLTPSSQNPGKLYTLLYIEDNQTNRMLVEEYIKDFSHLDLITADTPESGLEIAGTHVPDIILLDINLPGMDGYKVLELLQQSSITHHIPVVAVTANAMPKDIERGKAAGFCEYLTKPLNLQHLEQTISNLLSNRPC